MFNPCRAHQYDADQRKRRQLAIPSILAEVDPSRAFGATLGKALQPLGAGVGLIPILVALQ